MPDRWDPDTLNKVLAPPPRSQEFVCLECGARWMVPLIEARTTRPVCYLCTGKAQSTGLTQRSQTRSSPGRPFGSWSYSSEARSSSFEADFEAAQRPLLPTFAKWLLVLAFFLTLFGLMVWTVMNH